ncbi:MAG: flagellar export protein FliJ [Methylophaga sp.]|nr:flagellar export protein FliJ [Methylophaga sp.]
MTRAQKLIPVIAMARREAEQAQLQLADANRLLYQEQHQLQDLQHYRQQYLQRFRSADPQVMSARKAIELRSFLVQLDQAIQMQEKQVRQYLGQSQHKQQIWLQARSKQQAMETLLTRYQQQELQQQQRREQLLNDEYSAQLWRRKQF